MWNWRRCYVSYWWVFPIYPGCGLWAVPCCLPSLWLLSLTLNDWNPPAGQNQPGPCRTGWTGDCGAPRQDYKNRKIKQKTSHLSPLIHFSSPPSLLLTLVWNSDLYNWEDCANNQCQSCNLVFHQRNKNFPASMEQIRAELDILTIILVEGTETAPAAGHWYSTWL